MSVGSAKLELTKGNEMDRFKKLDEARDLLMAEYKKPALVYSMLYGYLAAMANDKQAEDVLELVKERYSN
jgi:hypothetical protein